MARFDDLLGHIQMRGVGWIKASNHTHLFNINNSTLPRKSNWYWSKEETNHYENYEILIYKDPDNGHKYYVLPDPTVYSAFEKTNPKFYCK